MLGLMFLVPILFALTPRKWQQVPTYLAGANLEGSVSFQGAMGSTQKVGLRNYYLAGFLSENKLTVISIVVTILIITAMFAAMFKPVMSIG
jgi:hypothetical protein